MTNSKIGWLLWRSIFNPKGRRARPFVFNLLVELRLNYEALACEPAVLISSIHDNYVPPKYHRMVFSAYAGPHFSLALDGGHNTAPDHSAEFPAALDWLWQQIGLPAVPPSTSPAPSPTHEFAG